MSTYLFIHQNMPAQFLHMCRYLRDRGHRIAFITRNQANELVKVQKVTYELSREPKADIHPYLQGPESGVLHGQAVYRATAALLKQNFNPDLVVGHAGWGETLFMKDLLPKTPLLSYFEFFYQAQGRDLDFDPEYPSTVDNQLSTRFKNTVNLIAMESCDWGLTPTQWQFSTYPLHFQSKMSVIHEGIDTKAIRPQDVAAFTTATGKTLHKGQKIVTYVARNLEPYRGFHIFMRAIPEIQRRHPDAEILIVGSEGVSYGRRLPEGDSYKKRLLSEVSFNADTVHFTGHLETEQFRKVMQVSSAHVYLTYPFVLSWSLLEAMASGCLIVGSRTPPVEEVIAHRVNGLLVDFFNVNELADAVCEVLARPEKFKRLRDAARATAVARFDLETVSLPRQIALLDDMMRRH
ncbi:glycosyltransferase family 4 protein [Bradyrhizobium liaoningense]|nr:glycosyltransferase family 4 protein [Bradyrhizobium liaoningense]